MHSMRRVPARVLVLVAVIALTCSIAAQERDRAKIPDKYKWNLVDLYPSDAAWRQAKDQMAAEIPGLDAFKGKLATSAETLADALEKMSALDRRLGRLYVYAQLLADQDTRDAAHQGMKQEMTQLASAFSAAEAF